MAAGLSKDAIRARVRRALLRVGRDLAKQGHDSLVDRGVLHASIRGLRVNVCFNIIRASNGEVAGLPIVNVNETLTRPANHCGTLAENILRIVTEYETLFERSQS